MNRASNIRFLTNLFVAIQLIIYHESLASALVACKQN